MGKFLLLLVGAASLAAGTLTLSSTRQSMASTDQRLNARGDDAVARAVAHSGMAAAESALAAQLAATGTYSGPTTLAAPYQSGAYAVTITASGDEYTVHAEGRAGVDTSHVQRVYRFEQGAAGPPPSGPVPPFMASAMLIDNSLHVKDDFTLTSADPATNPTIHTNNSIKFKDGIARVDGFATYGNGIDFDGPNTEASVFHPNSNPDGLPVHQKVPKVVVPEFDAAAYRSLATRDTPGDLTLSGPVTLGTRENPEIWYVGGNLRTSGDVAISGYGTFIVNNTIRINHAVASTAGLNGESTLGFYTGNSVDVSSSGSLNVAAQFLVGNSFHASSGVTIQGSITTGNSIHLDGPFTTVYRPASSVLTDPFWPPDPSTPAPAAEPSGAKRLVTVSTRVW